MQISARDENGNGPRGARTPLGRARVSRASRACVRSVTRGGSPSLRRWSTSANSWRLTEAFRRIFEGAPNGLVVVGEDGKIQQTNARLNAMFGYSAEELVGQDIEILVPHRLRAGHAPLRAGFSAAPSARAMGAGRDLTGRRKDGVEIPIEIGLSAFSTSRGRVSCASVVDITERKRSELKLREANAQLEEFAKVAAHDLRSPMRGIVNLIDFVVEDFGGVAPASALNNLQRMRERAFAVERLIDDLLTYARAGRRSTKFETIDLAEVVEEIVASLPLPAGLRLERDFVAEPFAGARTPLATVLRNLISNAIEHHDREEMRIAVESRYEGDYVMIDVIDDGPGIPEAAQERVFQLFQTLAKSDKNSSGLGLAVAQRLVNGHGGRINVICADGRRGCVFRIWWPRMVRSDLDE